jgi:hypothetical protein
LNPSPRGGIRNPADGIPFLVSREETLVKFIEVVDRSERDPGVKSSENDVL